MYTISKFLSRNLFKLFQNLSNRFQGIEIHDLRIQKFHHDSVFQAELGVIDGAAKVENFTFVVMRCRNLLFEALSHHIISRIRQDFQRFLEIFGFHKDIIRIECGYCKNTNVIFCENSREFRKNADKRKIKYTLNTESSPSIISFNSILGYIICFAYEGYFFVGLANEIKIITRIDITNVRYFTDC